MGFPMADNNPTTTNNLMQQQPDFYPEFVTSENISVSTHPKNRTPTTEPISTMPNDADWLLHSQQ